MIPEKHLQALERVLAGKPEDPHDGFLAALTAEKLGRLEQMMEILKRDSSIDRFQLTGSIAQWGETNESISCVEWLLDNGVGINQMDSNRDGWTIAHSCALDGTVEMMRMLIVRGANLRAKHLKCHEVIHKALLNKNPAMLEYLLDLGIDPDLTNLNKYTLLDHALSDGRADLVELLKSRGASKGRHRVFPQPIRLKPNRYRRSFRWLTRKFDFRVGPAPAEFVEWMQRNELPVDLVRLLSETMPLESISGEEDELCDAPGIMQACEWFPILPEHGLLPFAETGGGGDYLVLDFIGGGGVGTFDHETGHSLNPRVDVNFDFAPTLGDAARKILGAPRW